MHQKSIQIYIYFFLLAVLLDLEALISNGNFWSPIYQGSTANGGNKRELANLSTEFI